MDFFYAMNAADITPLKTQLVDIVSSCLMKEPPYESVRPDQLAKLIQKEEKEDADSADEQHLQQQPQPTSPPASPPPPPPPPVNDGVAMVAQLRELVHLISRQDGEFVLKLALYTRRTLHLRSSPNYLVALCAREPNCLPFLQPYMEKIVLLPSDWLAIANFAYFYDCDAAHDYSRCVTAASAAQETATTSRGSDGATRRSVSPHGTPASRNPPSAVPREHPHGQQKPSKKAAKSKAVVAADPTRAYLPAALRASLVHCFKSFTPFQLSKYDNAAAEHRAHRKERRLLNGTTLKKTSKKPQADSTSSSSSSDDEDDENEKADCDTDSTTSSDDSHHRTRNPNGNNKKNAAAPRRKRKLTFTYKALIRLLHITEPAYTVCCLLGKSYPADVAGLKKMGLNLADVVAKASTAAEAAKPSSEALQADQNADGEAKEGITAAAAAEKSPESFYAASLSGTRMRLPVVSTWETMLSKRGNCGKVWDELIASRAVPYMALLRNLRNILTRTCKVATYKAVLEKLMDEQQVAASQQLPYRFYSAYLAVQEVAAMMPFLHMPKPPSFEERKRKLKEERRRAREWKRAMRAAQRGRGRGRGRGALPPVQVDTTVRQLTDLERRVEQAQTSFENPVASRAFLARYIAPYLAAIDSAITTAARLNVIPIKGTSIVVLCVTQALMEAMAATGAAAETASIQRKIDVVAVLLAMMLRSCEQCIVLLYCYDEYVVFREQDYAAMCPVRHPPAAALSGTGDNPSLNSWPSPSGWVERKMASQSDSDDSHSNTSDSNNNSSSSEEAPLPSSSSSSTDSDDPLESSRPQESRPARGFMQLVDALVVASTVLLERKTAELTEKGKGGLVATSFDMFADGAGAEFPYSFLDEVIERNMRVESLLVFDEGVHRTFAHMNRNAPAFGDLPTYLSRLRRSCSPDLVYVGVNLKAASPPPTRPAGGRPDKAGGPQTATQQALQRAAVQQRYKHHNDVLLTGFSDAILRLVAERVGGGPLSVIERAAETFQVARFSARANAEAWAERAKALKIVTALRESDLAGATRTVARGGCPTSPTPPPAAAAEATAVNSLAFPSSSSSPERRVTGAAGTSAAPSAVVLPSFDAQGKVVLSSATWDHDWGHRARRSERQLQQLTGSSSSAGLSSTAASVASTTSSEADVAFGGHAALPSIRRLFSKRSTMGDDEGAGAAAISVGPAAEGGARVEDSSSSASQKSGSGAEGVFADAGEAAWLVPQGKQMSPITHPQPFISLVKLLSATSSSLPGTSGGQSPQQDSTSNATTKSEGVHAAAGERGAASRGSSPATARARLGSRSPQPSRTSPSTASSTQTSTERRAPGKLRAATATAAAVAAPGTPLGIVRRLLTSYRVCRFFISSTFLDMNNERNAITLDIFPRLRRWAAKAGLKVTLLEVDLRWGIPAVATTRNLSTSVCLNEVSRCSPFFLGMIGARYGSCPPTPLQLVVDEDVEAEDYDWMKTLTDPRVSVTELEMRHAMYNTRRRIGSDDVPTALFFARDYDRLMSTFHAADAALRRVYEGDSPSAAASIAALKQRIHESGYTVTTYNAGYRNRSATGVVDGRPREATAATQQDGHHHHHYHSSLDNATDGAGVRAAPPQSSTRALLEDDLGRWAVRGGRALDSVGPTTHTLDDTVTATDGSRGDGTSTESLWSLMKARITEADEPKLLTSMDVPLDMSDFSSKVFAELQRVICHVCGVAMDGRGDVAAVEDEEEVEKEGRKEKPSVAAQRVEEKQRNSTRSTEMRHRDAASRMAASPASPTAVNAPDLYETLIVAQSEYARKLSALYAAPAGLLEQLASFALAGTLDSNSNSSTSPPTPGKALETREEDNRRTFSPSGNNRSNNSDVSSSKNTGVSPGAAGGRSQNSQTAQQSRRTTTHNTNNNNSSSVGRSRAGSPASRRTGAVSSILLVEGADGDGKSSTLASLAERILLPMQRSATMAEAHPILFYSAQAGDDSVRSLLIFLVTSYRAIFHLYAELTVRESDSVEQLLLALDQAYAIVHRRYEGSSQRPLNNAVGAPAALVVILDGLDKSSEAGELVSLLGTVLHPLAAPHIRFIVSACPRSSLAAALRTRTPAARVVPLPLLGEVERAQLVRLHLAAYGKLLEESFSADELKELLRKSAAGRPSRLISAITYLRLFSTFDTLREDIRSLPSTSTQLYVKFFQQLQRRFDVPTCRLVLTLLLLRHPVGGVMEYNLYRLVSNVAVASRLVALLRGICLDAHHGRLFITSTAFVAAVAHTYLPYMSDYQSAQERVLVAELRYQPVDMAVDEQEVRQALRRTRESIERNAVDPLAPCPFDPKRYAPRELLGVLQGSVQASRLDVTATLVCYLPFLECLLINRRMLSQLLGLLSSIVHATKSSSDGLAAASAVDSAYGTVDAFTTGENGDGVDEQSAAFMNGGGSRSGGGVVLQWRHYRREVRRISNVLDFLQAHYHILLRQPSQLRQCVWNAATKDTCISVYDASSTAQLRSAMQQAAATATSNRMNPGSAEGEAVRNAEAAGAGSVNALTAPNAIRSNSGTPAAHLRTVWVHWLNLRQHGGDTRVLLTTASPQPIRCMALSPDGTEVALGGADGFVRRVCATEDEDDTSSSSPQQQPGNKEGGTGGSGGGGSRSRLASTLRHEAAVTAVYYVPSSNDVPAGLSGRGGSASSSPAPHLLVSGCERGILYVWNLEDNSLLQRGTGHLRGISGLVCHPLMPTVLCSCSHDSYVMLWNLCGTRSQLADDVIGAIALRLPKYPANSRERRQQQQWMQNALGGTGTNAAGEGGAAQRRGRGATAVYQSSLAARSSAARPDFLTPLYAFHTERQHRTPVSCVDFHGSGDIMASGSWDGVVLLYNTRQLCTPPPVIWASRPKSFALRMSAANISPEEVKRLRQFRERHGAEHQKVMFTSVQFSLGSPVRSISFSSSLAVSCVVGCNNGTVVVIDHASSAVVARWTALHTAPITRVVSSPDGRCVATADEHGVVRLTHNGISGSVFATLNGHHGAVTGLCFRAAADAAFDGLQTAPPVLLTAGEDRTMQAWRVDSSSGPEAKSTTRLLTTAHSTAVTAVAVASDGLTMVTGSADGTAIVFCVPEEDSVGGWADAASSPSGAAGGGGSGGNFSALPRAYAGQRRDGAPATAAARPMAPSFVLRHDECRITCIRFAMHDTRIVVGVAFGLLYVWSALPGLNRIEGRLLLRVRVPEHGLYPVVSIGVREAPAAANASDSATDAPSSVELSREASESVSEWRPAAFSSAASRNGGHPRERQPSSSSMVGALSTSSSTGEAVGAAVVTAVCANGDVAVLKLLGDAASRVMAADQARRRQLHRQHQQPHLDASTDTFSASSSSGLALFDGPGVASSTSVATVVPTAEQHGDGDEDALPLPFPPSAQPPQVAVPRKAGVLMVRTRKPPPEPVAKRTKPAPFYVVSHAMPGSMQLAMVRKPHLSQTGRRRAIDRRAMKLQRLLARCRENERELKESFLLDLHRHRLQWSDSAVAEEITAVVWLNDEAAMAAEQTKPSPPQDSVKRGPTTDNKHRRLALVVTQRKLFLMLSNGHDSAVSGSLNIRVPHQTSEEATLLRGDGSMPEEGAEAAFPSKGGIAAGCQREPREEEVRAAAEVLGRLAADSTSENAADAAAAAVHQLLRDEAEVDVEYLLKEEEYFTAASVAVGVPSQAEGDASSSMNTHSRQCSSRGENGTAVSASRAALTRACVVALTTSCGEVLLLRIQTPHLHRKNGCPPHASANAGTAGEMLEKVVLTAGDASATAAQLAADVLPRTQLHLCQRVSFAAAVSGSSSGGGVSGTAGGGGAGGDDAMLGAVGGAGATPQRTSVAPLATTVQLSLLPDFFLESAAATTSDNAAASSATQEQSSTHAAGARVALMAGCSDGSTRVWVVPTTPLSARPQRSPSHVAHAHSFASVSTTPATSACDVPVGCFFCTSPVSVVSSLLRPRAPETRRPPTPAWLATSAMHAETRAPQPPPQQPPRWVVGDSLGNVYQLQLERDAPGGMAAILRSCAGTTQGTTAGLLGGHAIEGYGTSSGAGANARPWAASLQRLVGMMDHPPSAEALHTILATAAAGVTTSLTNGTNGGGGDSNGEESSGSAWATGASQAPADWLTSVDMSVPVAATLLKRSRLTSTSVLTATQTPSAPRPTHAAGTNTPKEEASMLPCFGSAVAAGSSARSCLPEQKWSVLPELPSTLRMPSSGGAAFTQHLWGPSTATASKLNSDASPVPTSMSSTTTGLPASPTALPSFGTAQHRAEVAARNTANASGGHADPASTLRFDTPLSEVLSAYRRTTPDDASALTMESEMARLTSQLLHHNTSAPQQTDKSFLASRQVTPQSTLAASAAVPVHGSDTNTAAAAFSVVPPVPANGKPSVHFTLPPSHVVSTPPIPAVTQREVSAAQIRVNDATAPHKEEEEEEEEDYFGILYKTGPPSSSSGSTELRRRWLAEQQEVLKEAMRVQKYNKEARAALKAYQQRMSAAVGM